MGSLSKMPGPVWLLMKSRRSVSSCATFWGELRQLKQDPSYPFIRKISHVLKLWAKFHTRLLGSVDGHHLSNQVTGGTFTDNASFSECFANLARSPRLDSKEQHHPWRRGLLKDAPIVFTYADLHAGWYPAPWEFYKTRYTAKATARGFDIWEIFFILESPDSHRGFISFESFSLSMGS
jgi:hypothetical protein